MVNLEVSASTHGLFLQRESVYKERLGVSVSLPEKASTREPWNTYWFWCWLQCISSRLILQNLIQSISSMSWCLFAKQNWSFLTRRLWAERKWGGSLAAAGHALALDVGLLIFLLSSPSQPWCVSCCWELSGANSCVFRCLFPWHSDE